MLLTVCGAFLTLAAAWSLGAVCTRRAAGFAASLAVGSTLLSLVLFGVMAAHIATTPAIATVLGLSLLLNLVPPRPPFRLPKRPPCWVCFVLVPFALYAVVNALAPEVESDPNVYHLKPAIDAGTEHGFTHTVGFYERLPHATELLYVPAYRIGGDSAARLVHLSFWAATIPLIVTLGMYFGLSVNAAWMAALLYGISPVVLVSAASAFNDAALVFATVTSITVLVTGGPVWIAGLTAGFCYSVKMTGGITAVAGLLWLLWHRRVRDAVVFGISACVPPAPWLLRNLIQIHNPFAPFGNRWFPNPLFHLSTEQQLGRDLRNYRIAWWQRFPEVLWGYRVQGLIGPVFVLLPAALLAVRRRSAALFVGSVLLVPWAMNAGTRFLLPALPFLILAMASVIPVRALAIMLAIHAVLSWPQVIGLYQPYAWRLQRFPWRVPLGMESREAYLQRTDEEYSYARMVERNTTADSRVLDFYGLHSAHIRRNVMLWWQAANSEGAMRTLEFAREPGGQKFFVVRATFAKQPIRAVRVRPPEASPASWSVVEVDAPAVALSAKPNRWETPLAFDHNWATRWLSWEATNPRQWIAAEFSAPVEMDTVRIVSTHWDGGNTRLDVDVQQPNGVWIPATTAVSEIGPLNVRQEAIRYVKQLGFTHIVGRSGDAGTEVITKFLVQEWRDWNVQILAEQDGLYVLRLK